MEVTTSSVFSTRNKLNKKDFLIKFSLSLRNTSQKSHLTQSHVYELFNDENKIFTLSSFFLYILLLRNFFKCVCVYNYQLLIFPFIFRFSYSLMVFYKDTYDMKIRLFVCVCTNFKKRKKY